jgi:dihydrofolate reductase
LFYGENSIVGAVTYLHNLETFSNLDPDDKELLVLTRNENFDLHGNSKAVLVHDYMQVVDKYKNSVEVLIVGGGKEVWELFLPYADEMLVACCDKALPGDIEFSSWKDAPMVETKRELWNGGATIYYKRDR